MYPIMFNVVRYYIIIIINAKIKVTLNKEMLQGHFTKIITTRCQSVMYISFCCSYVFVAAASRKYKTTQGRLQPPQPPRLVRLYAPEQQQNTEGNMMVTDRVLSFVSSVDGDKLCGVHCKACFVHKPLVTSCSRDGHFTSRHVTQLA